jgi:hypothetical protein
MSEVEAPALARIAKLRRALSLQGRAAYLEAEFFGGDGMQAAILAENGGIVPGPFIIGAINAALSFLGVISAADADEFQAVGLDQHRMTDQWLAD